jgi:hypothetical protein
MRLRAGVGVIGVLVGLGCAGSAVPAGTPSPAGECPPVVSLDQPAGFGSVFVDGRRIATNLAVRRTSAFPESYEIDGPEPDALAEIPVERIDLVQYDRGDEAERMHSICPGTVALLFTTKPSG